MTCQEFHALVAAHALGTLDAEERTAAEEHLALAEHDGCREALLAATETVHELPLALTPVRPAAGMWDRIAPQLSPSAVPIERARRRPLLPTVIAVTGWLAAAAAVTALLVTGDRHERARLAEVKRGDDAEQRVTRTGTLLRECAGELTKVRAEKKAQDEAFAVAQLPGSRLLALAPQGDAPQRATILVNTDAHRAVIMAQGLLAQVDKDYELWVIRGDHKLAAGLLRANARGELALVVDSRLLEGGVDAFAVTLEPAGGGEAPRGPILLVGKV